MNIYTRHEQQQHYKHSFALDIASLVLASVVHEYQVLPPTPPEVKKERLYLGGQGVGWIYLYTFSVPDSRRGMDSQEFNTYICVHTGGLDRVLLQLVRQGRALPQAAAPA